MSTPDLLIVGSIGLDTIETPEEKVERVLGGAACYASYAASSFCCPAIVGVVGDDFPSEHESLLRDQSIDLTCLERKPGNTFFWHGRYEKDMNIRETLVTELGVFAEFSPQIPRTHTQLPYVFLANIHPQLQLDVLDAMQGNPIVAADTMNLWIDTTPDLLRQVIGRVDIMFINDDEARMITQQTTLPKAAQSLMEMGPKAAVIKRGDAGAMIFFEDDIFCVPAIPITAKDPTGAGDTFAGGMMGYLTKQGVLNRQALRQAAVLGTVMASFTVEDFSLNRLLSIHDQDILNRIEQVHTLTAFDEISI